MSEKLPSYGDTLVRFGSLAEFRTFVRNLYDHYQEDVDSYGDAAGKLMRKILARDEQLRKTRDDRGRRPDIWERIGTLLFNRTDELLGKNEVTLQALEEAKFRLAGTMDVLRALNEFEQFDLTSTKSLSVYFKDGIPDRIIAEKSPDP